MYSVTMDGLCCSWNDTPEDAPPLSNSAEDDDDEEEDEDEDEEEEEEE